MLRRLRNVLGFFTLLRWADAEAWEESDRRELQAFLSSQSGRRFSVLLRNMVLNHQSSAVQNTSNLEWACGRAHGFAGAVHLFDTLVATPMNREMKSSEMPENETSSWDDLTEHLRP